MTQTINLSGQRAVITGAAGGLGRAFAIAFARAGATVMVADVNQAGLDETVAMIAESGAKAVSQRVDVTNTDSCAQLATAVVEQLGGIDTLVNNAAMYAGLERRNFTDIEEDVWDKVMAVNVKGVWQVSRALLPKMNGGSIINIASATVFSGSPQWMHYVASKGAVIAMSRSMARELGDQNIRVNVIAPGFTLTEASLDLIENARSYGVDRGALKRPAETEDMVGTALFLASDASSYMTGQTLVVDGGRQFN